MNLDEIRKEIDILDGKLIKLLNDRMEQTILAKRFKKKIEDKDREKQIIKKIENYPQNLLDGVFLKELYQKIIAESKQLQNKDIKLIAFQGEHGAYSEVAAKAWNEQYIPLPCDEFTTVFEGIKDGLYEYGIVPVENTLGGIVSQVYDLIINTELFVSGAIETPISYCLVAYPGTNYREIREVYSHPQVLAQCRGFLAKNKLKPIPFYDTAGAAKMLSEKRLSNTAAISSKLAAQMYNLEIIKTSIEDHEVNRTRFLILTKDENRETGNKCSVVFSTTNKSGTLLSVLEKFAKAELNLTRIESIPTEEGAYAFFLDFTGEKDDPEVIRVFEQVKEITEQFRVLGFYKEVKIT